MSKKNFDCTSRHRFGGWQTLHTDPELKTRSKKFSIDISSKQVSPKYCQNCEKNRQKNCQKNGIPKRIGKKTRQSSKKLSASFHLEYCTVFPLLVFGETNFYEITKIQNIQIIFSFYVLNLENKVQKYPRNKTT